MWSASQCTIILVEALSNTNCSIYRTTLTKLATNSATKNRKHIQDWRSILQQLSWDSTADLSNLKDPIWESICLRQTLKSLLKVIDTIVEKGEDIEGRGMVGRGCSRECRIPHFIYNDILLDFPWIFPVIRNFIDLSDYWFFTVPFHIRTPLLCDWWLKRFPFEKDKQTLNTVSSI